MTFKYFMALYNSVLGPHPTDRILIGSFCNNLDLIPYLALATSDAN